MTTRRCEKRKLNGEPCKGTPRLGSKFCTFHDPKTKQTCDAGRRAGGVNRSRPRLCVQPDNPDLPLKTITDVLDLIGSTVNDVRKGKVDPKIGNCIGVLAGVFLRAFEASVLPDEIAALKAQLEELKRDRDAEARASIHPRRGTAPDEADQPP